MKKTKDPSLKAIRHILSSIDLSDLKEVEMTEAELKAYWSTISVVFSTLEKDIKGMIHEQLLFANNNADDWYQVVFARGTMNGMMLLLEKWRTAHNDHITTPKDEINNEIFPEL